MADGHESEEFIMRVVLRPTALSLSRTPYRYAGMRMVRLIAMLFVLTGLSTGSLVAHATVGVHAGVETASIVDAAAADEHCCTSEQAPGASCQVVFGLNVEVEKDSVRTIATVRFRTCDVALAGKGHETLLEPPRSV